jgi:hypothetical protein
VFIFNHQSALDMPLMLKLVRKNVTGIGKKELRWNPIFGPLFRRIGETVRPGPAGRRGMEGCDGFMKLRSVVQRVRTPPGQG